MDQYLLNFDLYKNSLKEYDSFLKKIGKNNSVIKEKSIKQIDFIESVRKDFAGKQNAADIYTSFQLIYCKMGVEWKDFYKFCNKNMEKPQPAGVFAWRMGLKDKELGELKKLYGEFLDSILCQVIYKSVDVYPNTDMLNRVKFLTNLKQDLLEKAKELNDLISENKEIFPKNTEEKNDVSITEEKNDVSIIGSQSSQNFEITDRSPPESDAE